MKSARDLHICGIVQGVGFRPFIYRQAANWGLDGWVLNASDGVHVHIEGDDASLAGFVDELLLRVPSAALINSLAVFEAVAEGMSGFSIRGSLEQPRADTLISPDIATCPLCLKELFDERDRRFHYPFINCTNCGPRFTIIDALPYDRAHTSMADFEMCEACATEYRDPLNRRFHAQPDACFDCGPTLRLWRSDAENTVASGRDASDLLIREAAALIEQGNILAIKGLGGYHLACDATNETAVRTLRERKRRSEKPFALMVRDLDAARSLCRVSASEASVLAGTIRPVVLLERLAAPAQLIALSVAGRLHELGIMLPSTPLQHLLLAAIQRPLVMTSGNISEEPIISEEDEAHRLLGGIADAFLDNDREILSRYDDSVIRVIDEHVFMVRRARGYAPRPLPFLQGLTRPADAPGAVPSAAFDAALDAAPGAVPDAAFNPASGTVLGAMPDAVPGILATGPEQKNCFCLVRENQAFVSQHLGDQQNASAFSAWLATLALYERLFDLSYQAIACDMHPEYLPTKWAKAQDKPLIEVQHHHAHIASVLAEHRALKGLSYLNSPIAPSDQRSPNSPSSPNSPNSPSIPYNPVDPIDPCDSGIIRTEQVIGIAFDGTGYGLDSTIWGGECLIASLTDFWRFAHLKTVPLPGGQAAIKHPNRMAWAQLKSLDLTNHEGAKALVASIGESNLLLLDRIIDGRINSPLTSSMGRLFDAVSALVGICAESSYEGQAAVELEAAIYDPHTQEAVTEPCPDECAKRYRFTIQASSCPTYKGDTLAKKEQQTVWGLPDATVPLPLEFDPTFLLVAILEDLQASVSIQLIARRFHDAVVRLIVDLCREARSQTKISTVALSGGVFMNRYLLSRVIPLLEEEGFEVLLNRDLPANDGCISYGQAAVAAGRLAQHPDKYIPPNTPVCDPEAAENQKRT